MAAPRGTRRSPSGLPGAVGAPGFTLIETALATVVIGVGVLAMVDAQQAFINANRWSSHAASATFLANEIREYTRRLPKHDPVVGLHLDGGTLDGWGPDAGETTVADFDDLDDFDGLTFSFVGTAGFADGDLPGPIDAFGDVIPEISAVGDEDEDAGMFGWSQTVIVQKLDPFDFATTVADAAFSDGSAAPRRAVDEYPLRVTVEVRYQGVNDVNATLVTSVSWIVP
jgi:type II secretory pathway pseudopilin PulG